MEDLKNYFENTKGMGVMATADKEGKANYRRLWSRRFDNSFA